MYRFRTISLFSTYIISDIQNLFSGGKAEQEEGTHFSSNLPGSPRETQYKPFYPFHTTSSIIFDFITHLFDRTHT